MYRPNKEKIDVDARKIGLKCLFINVSLDNK